MIYRERSSKSIWHPAQDASCQLCMSESDHPIFACKSHVWASHFCYASHMSEHPIVHAMQVTCHACYMASAKDWLGSQGNQKEDDTMIMRCINEAPIASLHASSERCRWTFMVMMNINSMIINMMMMVTIRHVNSDADEWNQRSWWCSFGECWWKNESISWWWWMKARNEVW